MVPPRLDRARGAVADLEEAHQAGRAAAAGKLFAFAAQAREVRAGAGAVFEQARLAHPEVHDAALVDEVVLDALDEAGVRLRMLVGRFRLGQLAGDRIDVIVALAGAIDAVGPVQAGVEPLRRVRRDHLLGQHEAQLVEEGLRVFFRSRSSCPSSPNRSSSRRGDRTPAWRESSLTKRSDSRAGAASASVSGTERHSQDGTVSSSTFFRRAATPALRKYFCASTSEATCDQNSGHLDVFEPEHDRAIGIADLRCRQSEINPCVG